MTQHHNQGPDHGGHAAEALTRWLQSDLGCTDVRLVQERRWRPVWRAFARRDGQDVSYLLKGDRTWPTHPYPLEYEMAMQDALHRNGVPIPAIVGWCENPKTIAMEWISGGRDPGLIQEAIESASTMSPERWEASLRYMDILADVHRIPPQEFVSVGATMPETGQEIALGNFERFHAMSTSAGLTDPLIEFCARWLRRNVPPSRTDISFVTGDCGQFLSDGPEVTGILDVEIGHLGDPMRDLACFRCRHPIENMGDVPALYRRYEQAKGKPNDYDAIAYHTVSFMAEALYGPLFGLRETGPGGDWVESLVQLFIIGRRGLEGIAEIIGLPLEDLTLPHAEPTSLEDMALAKLSADLGRLKESDNFQPWQRNVLLAVPAYLAQRGHYRFWLEEQLLNDAEALLGTRPADVPDADAKLIDFVRSAEEDQDAALVRLFHRRALRECLVIAGPNPVPHHIALAKIEPFTGEMRLRRGKALAEG